ncbi:MAG: hypothetical protein IC227_03600 [Enterococcus lacertideformus]|uniref:Lantibiotic dehydratase N-terminal domain-containing protein n=1 Tax=Enterococcus lacertideformus TaxID=2771493 RepID=A0A931AYE1_9ENTE|nr:hypothetical protein [Enterococcus lacertideformus]
MFIEELAQKIFDYLRTKNTFEKNEKNILRTIKKIKIIKYEGKDVYLINLIKQFNRFVKIYNESENNLSKKFEDKLVAERRTLQQIYRENPDLVSSIKFTIGGSVIEKVDKYLSLNSDEHNKKFRKMDRLLLTYLLRATVKTSPLADLVVTEISGLEGNDGSMLRKITINHSFLMELLDKVVERNEQAVNCVFTINRTMIKTNEEIIVTIPISSRDEQEDSLLINNRQGLASIKRIEIFEKFLDDVGDSKSYLDLLELANLHFLNPHTAKKILTKLISGGFIVRKNILNDASMDFFDKFLDYIKEKNIEPWLQNQFSKVITSIRKIEKEKRIEIADILTLENLLEQIINKYGLKKVPSRNLVYFDYSKSSKFQEDFRSFRPLIECLQFISLALDSAVRSRVVVSESIKNWDGEVQLVDGEESRASLFRMLGKLLEETNQPSIYTGKYNFSIPERSMFINKMNKFILELFSEMKNSSKDEIILSLESLSQRIVFLKEMLPNDILSHTFFFQKIEDNSIVINHIYNGFTTFISRFSKAYGRQKIYQAYVNKTMPGKILM